MTQESPSVLALNGGSSSIKFVLCQTGDPPKQGLHGKVDLIGLSSTTFVFNDPAHKQQGNQSLGDSDRRSAARFLFDCVDMHVGLASIMAVGHRVVSGGVNY